MLCFASGPATGLSVMSSTAERHDVVIAGGGTAGLALACALADALGSGARIAVADRAPLRPGTVAAEPRAFALSAGSKHMLSVLGVWPAIAAHAQPVTAVDITDSSLDDAIRPILVSYDNTVGGGEPATYIVEEGRLREALLAAAANRTAIALLGGEAVAVDVELDALQRFSGRSVLDAGDAGDDALVGRAHAFELKGARAACVGERAVGGDVIGRISVGMDHHLAADAVRTGDAAEQDVLGVRWFDHAGGSRPGERPSLRLPAWVHA